MTSEQWNRLNSQQRLDLAMRCGWRTNANTPSALAKKFAKLEWDQIIPSTQAIFSREVYATISGRNHIALLARGEGEEQFAREVVAGCWDHRSDVSEAISFARRTTRSADQ